VLKQAEDRIHRVGQAGACNYVYLVAAGTVDDDMLEALRDKQSVVDKIVRS
jgi:SNF2 family DNA or RNA helicase